MRTEYCSKCGSILEKGAKFCTECGAKVTDAADIKGYVYTIPEENRPFNMPAAEPAQAAGPEETPAAPVEEPVPCYVDSAAPEEASPADSWKRADAFTDAPEAPEVPHWNSEAADPASEGSWQANAGGFQQMTAPPAVGNDRKNTLLILGIVTIVFAFIVPLVSYICGIVGLVMASKAKKSGEDIGSGRTLCIIGLVLAVLNSILGILVSVFVILSEFTDVFGTFISW
ncbi:MAG: zinc-ribbon domain-containing protein [Oscillospiraceae bacterium]|nr:zinc-ribbon domain-containing protein [Oscillospiraceae bacterium]